MKRKELKPEDRLIVSIDVSTRQQTISVCQDMANRVSTVKVGLELIYSQGLGILDTVKSFGYNIMLDSKIIRHTQHSIRSLQGHCSNQTVCSYCTYPWRSPDDL
ncbi:MAG: orotidine 5'-phosphate decarboxylase / HUMPS family protein [Actinomycetota bacterium]|nr:orotidine 5'-phosphate decarboxylase / HUMPS family protein [Actinomycetota bacterium]